MMKPGMKRFVLLTVLAALPALLLVAFYLIRDPFHVVKPYKGQLFQPSDSIALTTNWGYVTVESFKHFDPQEHFDSFIFGSSLSGYYLIKDWEPHLPSGSRPFHFNASRETLYGILNKLNWLTERGVKIKNALLVIEDEMLQRRPLDADVLFAQHPETAPNLSWWDFQQLYFNAYRRPELVAYLFSPQAMTERVLEEGYATTDVPNRDESTNESYYIWADSVIAVNPDEYFTAEFEARYRLPLKQLPCPDKITPTVTALLMDIKRVLKRQGADYQIIIPPVYGYESISSNDLYKMEKVFGMDRVHDYSHDAELQSNLRHYYDGKHLLAADCARLIDSAYNAVTLLPQSAQRPD